MIIDPLAEAEAIRNLLHEVQGRLSRLVVNLKQHGRQTQSMHSAFKSLRRLPPLSA
jgi:hypothetical protein